MQPIQIVIATKFWSFLPKFGHATNSNCYRNQILVILTKNWSRDQFKLSSQPNFGNFYQNLVTQPIPIVMATKFW